MRFKNLSEYFYQESGSLNSLQTLDTYERFIRTSKGFYELLTSEGVSSKYTNQLDKAYINNKYVEKFDSMIKAFEKKGKLKHQQTRVLNHKQIVTEKISITYSQSLDILNDYRVTLRTGQFTGFFRDYANIVNTSITALKKKLYLELLTYLENIYSDSSIEEALSKGAELFLFEIDGYLQFEDFLCPEVFVNIDFTEEEIEFFDEETGAQEKELCFCTNLHMDFFVNQS